MTALLPGRHLEGAAGAGGGFLEEQHDVFALQGLAVEAYALFGLQVPGQIQQVADLGGGQVLKGEKGTSL